MIETEILGDLTLENFERYLKYFTETLGKPFEQKRIAFMVLEKGAGLDNRVKITNGVPQIVQKFTISSDGQGKRNREEITINLPKQVSEIKDAIKIFEHFYKSKYIKPLSLVVQHENYIWIEGNTELKLSHQFGKSSLYVFEVEALKPGENLEEFMQKHNLIADFESLSHERKLLRENEVDLRLEDLSEVDINNLIQKYLAA